MTNTQTKQIILAEDDEDDTQFFESALNCISDPPELIHARDGVELTIILRELENLPDVVFIDLNMPRKNGAQCLQEIREAEAFKDLPVVVLSTTSNQDVIDAVYHSGANLYVQKPSDMQSWKNAIAKVLSLDWNIHCPHAVKERFYFKDF
ncbi:MAG: response regulator [Bacteroidota bacterium]|nr:response regulator [Bacteroidota bacterium]